MPLFELPGRLLRGVLDLCCPPICPLCQNLRADDAFFCPDCTDTLPTPPDRLCLRCGGRRFQRSENKQGCARCRTTPFRFHRVVTLGEYEKELRQLVLRMKTDRSGLLATAAAGLLAELRRADFEEIAPNLILPVPMHRSRSWQRGVNSPDFVAAELGRRLRCPVNVGILRRTRPTELQYLLSANNRQKNLRDAFALRRPDRIAGKRILLIDDILTTGSTANEIAGLLLRHGAASVRVAVLARSEGIYAQAAVKGSPLVEIR